MSKRPPHDHRITDHPILPIEDRPTVEIRWQGRVLAAAEGEPIATALFAHGIRSFGHHPKDQSPQGIFCANGQCAQCTVIADGRPVKACMVPVEPGMCVEPAEGLPALPAVDSPPAPEAIETREVECLIVGGGPAGLAAAIELGKLGVEVLLIDDKHRLGGKLVLQTHKFFGSIDDCYAGTRGTDIATLLEKDLAEYPSIECWLSTNAVAVFSDRVVGVVRDNKHYRLIRPRTLLVATGAREKSLTFRGNTLPGVYGAGAFQTLVNRDLVRASDRLFLVGGGNVGLIAGYHALQAGIQVVGLVEALPECGGYKVHADKLKRIGVPIYTSHTVISANGDSKVESVTIAEIDDTWQPIPGTEKSFECDTLLIAVGLDPVDEFYRKAVQFGMDAWSAGDAAEIAEASAAMFSGKIKGIEIARALGREVGEIPEEWSQTEEVLKSRPGAILEEDLDIDEEGVHPVFHCSQEIPCNPCTSICPVKVISVGQDMRGTPRFVGDEVDKTCSGCCQCLAVCPGLAITLVDFRKDEENPTVTIPHEFMRSSIAKGDRVIALDTHGNELEEVEVLRVVSGKKMNRTLLVRVRAPKAIAPKIAGIRVQESPVTEPMQAYVSRLTDDTIVCRCERATVAEVRELIRQGVRDINQIKTITRAGMGACGSKTCNTLIKYLFRQEGIPQKDVTDNVARPLFMEVPLGVFCGIGDDEDGHAE